MQTRDLTRREANEISRAATIAVARVTLRDPVYWLFLLLLVAGIVAVSVGFSHYSYWAWCAGVRFPTWAKIAFFVAIASFALAGVRRARARSTLTRQKHTANDRYTITADGVSIDLQGALTFLPWRRIHALTSARNCSDGGGAMVRAVQRPPAHDGDLAWPWSCARHAISRHRS